MLERGGQGRHRPRRGREARHGRRQLRVDAHGLVGEQAALGGDGGVSPERRHEDPILDGAVAQPAPQPPQLAVQHLDPGVLTVLDEVALEHADLLILCRGGADAMHGPRLFCSSDAGPERK